MDAKAQRNPEKVRSMFSQVAHRYDLANTILSGGIHHLWRKEVVRWSEAKRGSKVLDCATGTGDLAITFAKKVGEQGEVIGTDFCQEMLDSAPAKATKAGVSVRFAMADVMQLPFPDNYFDVVSISFGIRNVASASVALQEMARVTKPGGHVIVLEFGQVENALLRGAYEFYSEKLLPKIGGLITGQPQAYDYLQESSREFPCRENFLTLMKGTRALEDCQFRPLSFGVAYIYRGRKLASDQLL